MKFSIFHFPHTTLNQTLHNYAYKITYFSEFGWNYNHTSKYLVSYRVLKALSKSNSFEEILIECSWGNLYSIFYIVYNTSNGSIHQANISRIYTEICLLANKKAFKNIKYDVLSILTP